ncbi:hypothetical protein AcW1_009341 [Taiwanofungus camphoratus]|nr:hypothetical protein AcV5_003415 [Antrodia cinnamomea]KAI0935069.1 hypothetical protein AcV7_003976 [Antrodia cinnamomea]KAI0947634.1 hypothetical protein AcW1_009341 [Antrodia cinnamomea]
MANVNTNIVDSPELITAFESFLTNLFLQDQERRHASCLRSLTQGNALLQERRYEDARSRYLEAITAIIGRDHVSIITPAQQGNVISEMYVKLTMDERVSLMACCNGIAQCMMKTDREELALDWFEEVDVLYKTMRFAKVLAIFD